MDGNTQQLYRVLRRIGLKRNCITFTYRMTKILSLDGSGCES